MEIEMEMLKKLMQRDIVLNVFLSIALNVVMEILSKRSVYMGCGYMFRHPVYFIYGCAIIFLTLCIALFFKRKYFVASVVSFLWLTIGIVNCVLMYFRDTPFTAVDLLILRSALGIMSIYIKKWQLLLIALAVAAAAAVSTMLFKKAPKRTPRYIRAVITVIITVSAVNLSSGRITEVMAQTSVEKNLTESSYTYGFVCCFTNSFFTGGIEKPEGYSKSAVRRIMDSLPDETSRNMRDSNIIVLQLESFIDPYYIEGVTYSRDPIPEFRRLKENYSSGTLEVSVFGGGTANTEFEVITGMSTRFFGTGEYPYETILKESTCPSTAYDLQELGYKTHAIHDHSAAFYGRYDVYPNLGFESFIPIEYMYDVPRNSLGWARSTALTEYILGSLKSTEERDFIYTVTAQCHGKYPDTVPTSRYPIRASCEDKKFAREMSYYASELNDEDSFIGELLAELEKLDEPVTVVIFGDHMPAIDIDNHSVALPTRYQTEYVIWDNFGLSRENKTLTTYNLMAETLKRLNINKGVMTRFHQMGNYSEEEQESDFHILEYDLLYGGAYSLKDRRLPEAEEKSCGLYDIKIDSITFDENGTHIYGGPFNDYSYVVADDKVIEPVHISSEELLCRKKLSDCEEITVCQITYDDTRLGSTNTFKN